MLNIRITIKQFTALRMYNQDFRGLEHVFEHNVDLMNYSS